MSAAGGAPQPAMDNSGQRRELIFGCTGPLRPERCDWVGIVGELVWAWQGGQFLRTAFHTISISLQNSL